ncbi:helix-turn-helix domain-containing protein [Nocardia mexicana]|uniref:Helix-turn-helix protein n=1 Tax=Nocardia mexicana TaxID=279262 RepID=A0A370H1B8_9NOCA|nr:helix-turn-helix transcriptional regulator [Nocardia mexicana]RDI49647.1 helix-turn-helix protein [Nocardia mexicana]
MAGSTLSSRALGRQVKKYRERAGLTQHAVAKAVETSPQTYGRLEEGQKHNVTNLMLNAICDRLEVSDKERRLLLTLAEEVRAARKSDGNWWRAYADDLQTGFDHYMSLEQAARSMTTLQLSLIPGLLQTPGYRRQLAWAENPEFTPDEVEKRIELAMRRQERLSDPRFEVTFLISEAILRQLTGGPAVMAEQLRHLLEVGRLPGVSIRAIPFDATSPVSAVCGSFVLLEFPPLPSTKLTEPPVVFVEGFTGAAYLERDAEVAVYRDAIRHIRRIALDERATHDLIVSIAREYAE